ncbi:hypothetical protein [Maricaulis sp.]|uniref:hypothetical protein n=1 Tax=Maricaulis sp. TaxID=1486257 RepID=UPI003A94827F
MIELVMSAVLSQSQPVSDERANVVGSACAAAISLVIDNITTGWSHQENLRDRKVIDFYDRFACTPGEEGMVFISAYQRNATRGGISHYLVDVTDMSIVEITAER